MNTCVLVPLGDRVVVRPDEAESKTPGGLVIPDVAKEKPQRGTVLAVGPGRLLDDGSRAECPVAEGDRVLYTRYQGTTIELDGRDVVVLEEKDLLAKLAQGGIE